MAYIPALGSYITPEMANPSAKGDGVTDDSAALIAMEATAFANNLLIMLSPGKNYATTKTIGIRVNVMGNGAQFTALSGWSSGVAPVVTNFVGTSFGAKISWRDFTVNGNGLAYPTGPKGIRVSGVTGLSILQNIGTNNCHQFGLLIDNSSHVRVDNCTFTKTYLMSGEVGADGITIQSGSVDIIVRDCFIFDFMRNGIDSSGGGAGGNNENIKLLNNTIGYAHDYNLGADTEQNCAIYCEDTLNGEIGGNKIFNIASGVNQSLGVGGGHLFGIFGHSTNNGTPQPFDTVIIHDNIVEMATPQSILGVANNGSGLYRLTLASTAMLSTTASGSPLLLVSGTQGAEGLNGTWSITVIDATHVDLVGSSVRAGWVANTGFAVAPAGIAYVAETGYTDPDNETDLKMHHNTARYAAQAAFIAPGFASILIDGFYGEGIAVQGTVANGMINFSSANSGGWPSTLPPTPSITLRDLQLSPDCTVETAATQASIVFTGYEYASLSYSGVGNLTSFVNIYDGQQTPGSGAAPTATVRVSNSYIQVGSAGTPAFGGQDVALEGTTIIGTGNLMYSAGVPKATLHTSNCTFLDATITINDTSAGNDLFEWDGSPSDQFIGSVVTVDSVAKVQLSFPGKIQEWGAGAFLTGNGQTTVDGSFVKFFGANVSNQTSSGATLTVVPGGGSAIPSYAGGLLYSISSISDIANVIGTNTRISGM